MIATRPKFTRLATLLAFTLELLSKSALSADE